MKYICWETFLKKLCEMAIGANFFQNFNNLWKFAEIMDVHDETHIIHSCYAAGCKKMLVPSSWNAMTLTSKLPRSW